jgi:hypothetical protein
MNLKNINKENNELKEHKQAFNELKEHKQEWIIVNPFPF